MERDCCRWKYDDSDICDRDDDNQTAVLTRRSTRIGKTVDGALLVSYRSGGGRAEVPLCRFRKRPIENALYEFKGLAEQLWKELHGDSDRCGECSDDDCHCDDDGRDPDGSGHSSCVEGWEGPESGVIVPSYPGSR